MASDRLFITASMQEKSATPANAAIKGTKEWRLGGVNDLRMAAAAIERNRKGTLFRRHLLCRIGRLYFRRLRFDQFNDVLDHLCILHMMLGDAGKIDHIERK